MQLSDKRKAKNSRSQNQKEFYKYILFMGLMLASGIALLRSLESYYLIYSISTNLYIGIISALFLGLGLYLGIRYGKNRGKSGPKPAAVPLPLDLELSSRENEVLQNLALGYSNQEIADRLFLSINTVKSHTNSIYSKLNVKRRTQAIEAARKLNIIQ
jgi:DNA-binding CsgD family transcriptional regulator